MDVSKRALIKRINRALRDSDEKLLISRGVRMQLEVGDYYVVDVHNNCVVGKDLDLADFGRELGVLGPGEQLADC